VAAALLALGLLSASCADDAADTSSATPSSGGSASGDLVNATLPDNLCDEVVAAVPTEYGVDEVSHASGPATASCSLASESGATTLEVTLTLAPPDDLDAALTAVCEDVVRPGPEGRQERRCTAAGDGEVTQAASLSARSAVLLMTLRSDDPERIRTAGVDLALVESAVASA
jgi:hypothetical protein